MTESVGSITTGYPVDETRRIEEQRRVAERIANENSARERERVESAKKAVEPLDPDQTISTIV